MLVRLYQIFIFFLILGFSSNCILFKESELDPKSDLSNLFGLYQLFNLQRGVEYETSVKFLENGVTNGLTIVKVSRVPRDYTLPNPNLQDTSGELVGSFQQSSNGFHRLYFRDLGRFRLDLYKFSTNPSYHGSVVVDLLNSTDSGLQVVQEAFPNGYRFTEQKLTRIVRRDHDPFEIYINEEPSAIGFYNNKAFYAVQVLFNKKFEIQTSNIRLPRPWLILYTLDGNNFSSFTITEATSDAAVGSQSFDIQFNLEGHFTTEDSLVLFFRRTGLAPDPSYFITKIPFNQPENYQFYQVFNRDTNFGYDRIKTNKFFYSRGKLIYREFDSVNSSNGEWRVDTNLLQAGSGNTSIFASNYSPFSYGEDSIFQYKNFILNFLGSNFYISDFDLNDASPNTIPISHNSPIAGAVLTLQGNPFQFFLSESNTSPPAYRLSVSNQAPSLGLGNLTFSGGYFANQSYAPDEFIFHPDKTTYTIVTPGNFITRVEFNHTDLSHREVTRQPDIESLAGYTNSTSPRRIKNCNLLNQNYTCIAKRMYSGSPANLNDPFLITTSSSDGQSWSQWKELTLNPIVRK